LIATKKPEIKFSIDSSSGQARYTFRYGNLSDSSAHPFLIVLNGVPVEQEALKPIKPDDIQAVDILKDNLVGIIGCGPRRGIILITTKCRYTDDQPVF
jgi:hypothetical protein